jgi:NitT/TauT family transport system substrate-binding protein
MKKVIHIVAAIFLFLFADLHAQSLKPIRFVPHWLHQAQFSGYYLAKEKGFYKELGLDVTIEMGGPNAPVVPFLIKDKADITSMFLSGAIKAKATGADIVEIAQLSQRSALMFVAKIGKGIVQPADFNGKKIGIWRSDFQELPKGFLKKFNVEAELVPITSTTNLFLHDGVDAMCVMWYNEYHQILNFGINAEELNVFHFYDYDLDFPEDAIVCKASFYKNNKKSCEGFVQATLKGWEYAFGHKEEAIDLVIELMEEANIPANRAHQMWMLNRMQDVLQPDAKPMSGILDKEDYELTAKVLMESGSINFIPEFEEFNKTEVQK